MKKIFMFVLAVLPLVLGSCSSDGDEVHGTSEAIDVTVTFNDDDIAAKRNYNRFYVYLISTEGYTVVSEPNRLSTQYYVDVKDSNGKESRLYAEWWAKALTSDSELTARVWESGSVFPYGKCMVILEEWSGAAHWFKYINTTLNESDAINLTYGSFLMCEHSYD